MADKHIIISVAGTVVAACLAAVLVSPLGCGFLPPARTFRILKTYDDEARVLFRQEGYYRCFISIEGPFPEWSAATAVRFKDREAFLSYRQTAFVFPDDFTTVGDEIVSGRIDVDRERRVADVSFMFTGEYWYNAPVNGEYDMSNIGRIVLPKTK